MKNDKIFSYERPCLEIVLLEQSMVDTLVVSENPDMDLWPENGQT